MIDFQKIFKTNDDTQDFDFVEDFKARAVELKEDIAYELAELTILDWLCFICFCLSSSLLVIPTASRQDCRITTKL